MPAEHTRRIVVIGAGGFAREVVQLIADINAHHLKYELLGYLDDNIAPGSTVGGVQVLGSLASAPYSHDDVLFAIGIGSPGLKRRVAKQLKDAGFTPATLVHPSVLLGRDVRLGEGGVLCAGSILTCDITVGAFVTMNLACTVGHDAMVGDYATVAPGANISGSVDIGEGCDIGTGSATVQGVTIGEWSIIGAGAVVSRDLPANVTAAGVPAKIIKQREAGWQLSI